jgi:CRISPR system Cascade subunit CasA
MVFEMGECRPDDAPTWFDPFAAYRLPTDKKKSSAPTPIRPRPGQALWREFASLFLLCSSPGDSSGGALRPKVVHQLADMADMADSVDDAEMYAFRCVGLRTDGKAKVFEWVDAGFEVPPALLRDPAGGVIVSIAVYFAKECADIIRGVFWAHFHGKSQKSDRHRVLRDRMQDEFWAALAGPFRQFVLGVASPENREVAHRQWVDTVVHEARAAFRATAAAVGDDAVSLRQRVQGETIADIRLAKKRKEHMPNE